MGSVSLEGFGSGGAALNFKIVPGLNQPSDPKENTIWVKTEKITSWFLSPEAPADPEEGMVWIQTGATGPVALSVLKKGNVYVYPRTANQYIGGAWIRLVAMSYQDKQWVKWITYLYNSGDECTDISGGWDFIAGRDVSIGSYTENNDSITLKSSNSSGKRSIQATTKNKIDLSGKSFIKVNITAISRSSSAYLWFKYGTTKEMANGISRLSISAVGEHGISLENVSGSYYIGLEAYSDEGGASVTATFDAIWIE